MAEHACTFVTVLSDGSTRCVECGKVTTPAPTVGCIVYYYLTGKEFDIPFTEEPAAALVLKVTPTQLFLRVFTVQRDFSARVGLEPGRGPGRWAWPRRIP